MNAAFAAFGATGGTLAYWIVAARAATRRGLQLGTLPPALPAAVAVTTSIATLTGAHAAAIGACAAAAVAGLVDARTGSIFDPLTGSLLMVSLAITGMAGNGADAIAGAAVTGGSLLLLHVTNRRSRSRIGGREARRSARNGARCTGRVNRNRHRVCLRRRVRRVAPCEPQSRTRLSDSVRTLSCGRHARRRLGSTRASAMTERLTLPLGIDIGHRRVRIALLQRERDRPPTLCAVAACDYSGNPATALRAAVAELQTQERRCVLALTPPDALLRLIDLPPMPRRERVRAARFEAQRFIDYPSADAAVSLVGTNDDRRWAVGIVRRSALAASLGAARSARLRPLAVDDAAFALRRAHPDVDGVIDVGDTATWLTLFGRLIPYIARIPVGGALLTDAIAESLGIGTEAAEQRKRSVGFGGAGAAARDMLIAGVTTALADARQAGYAEIRDVVMCGNGSRIPGLDEAFGRACGIVVRPAGLSPHVSAALPADVLRAAGPDWSIAYGLGLWSIAA